MKSEKVRSFLKKNMRKFWWFGKKQYLCNRI